MHQVGSPQALASELDVPLIDSPDCAVWTAGIKPHRRALIEVFRQHEPALRSLYETLHASTYAPHGFAEFFCWYFHVAYAAAIDVLVKREHLVLPPNGFASAIWHEGDS